MKASPLVLLFLTTLGALSGCDRERDDPDVTLYVALDQQHSDALIRQFEAESGLKVRCRFDTEASKTVGLVTAILEEADRPRCDVFWNNEIAHTSRLAQKSLLAPYESPSAKGLPKEFMSDDGLYAGFAARARVLIVNTDLIPNPADRPTSIWDLTDPKWEGKCAIARPLTGTTLTHFSALRMALSEEDFERFIAGLFENDVQMMQSNGATMRAVRDGDLSFALTDTDDFHVARSKGFPVACVFPDQGDGEIGTMLIPNSVAMIRNAPHPDAAKRLIDFILSTECEAALAASRSAQIPLRAYVAGPTEPQILPVGSFRSMTWNLDQTARSLEESARIFQERFGS